MISPPEERFGLFSASLFGPVVLTVAAALSGCQTAPELQPAPEAHRVAGLERAARATVAGVTMIVQTEGWPGPLDIDNVVTPVRVGIENRSRRPLRISYDNFTLITATGARFAALPPVEIRGAVNAPRGIWSAGPVGSLAYPGSGFRMAPYYRGVYAGTYPFWDQWGYDPFYYDTYYGYWRRYDLPSPPMLELALTEGVLEGNGNVKGWLYFEKVEDARRVVFRADLVDAQTGLGLGEVRIPFSVSY